MSRFGFRTRTGEIFNIIQQSFDVDTIAFINRVTAAGGTLSTTEQNAVNQLVVDLKNYGIWSLCRAVYPMVGASAAACSQNLISASHTGVFTTGWTFASTGATPNGTSAYMNTGLMPNGNLKLNSTHLSYYSRTNISANQVDMGVQATNSSCYLLYSYSGTAFKSLNRAESASGNVYTPTIGLLIGNRPNSTTEKYYHRGSLINTITVNSNLLTNNYKLKL